MRATYKVLLSNFGTVLIDAAPTLERAIEVSVAAGFETTIISNSYDNVVGTWSPLNGYASLVD